MQEMQLCKREDAPRHASEKETDAASRRWRTEQNEDDISLDIADEWRNENVASQIRLAQDERGGDRTLTELGALHKD